MIKTYEEFLNEDLMADFNVFILKSANIIFGFNIPQPIMIAMTEFIKNIDISKALKYELTAGTILLSVFIAKLKEYSNKFLSKFVKIFDKEPSKQEQEEWVEIFQKLCKSKPFITTIKTINTIKTYDMKTFEDINHIVLDVLTPKEIQKLLNLKQYLKHEKGN